MTREELESKHIAELHALAAEAGVPRYRGMRREQLIDALLGEETEEREAPRRGPAPAPSRARPPGAFGRASRGGGGGDRGARHRRPGPRLPQARRTSSREPGDVYVSASQIRRCELRAGDEVSGPAREPRRGERHRALIKVDTGERRRADRGARHRFRGADPGRSPPADRARDRSLRRPRAGGRPACAARLRPAGAGAGRAALRADDAAARPGRGDRRGARAPGIVVLLVDERPEEVTEWRRQAGKAEIAAAAADLEPARPGPPRGAGGGAGEAAGRVRRGRRPDRRFPDPAGGRLRGSRRGQAGVRRRARDRGRGCRLADRDRHRARRDRGFRRCPCRGRDHRERAAHRSTRARRRRDRPGTRRRGLRGLGRGVAARRGRAGRGAAVCAGSCTAAPRARRPRCCASGSSPARPTRAARAERGGAQRR